MTVRHRRASLFYGGCSTMPSSRSPVLAMLLSALAACADTSLPELAVPLGENVDFGTDLSAPEPVLGITVTDPFHRLSQ